MMNPSLKYMGVSRESALVSHESSKISSQTRDALEVYVEILLRWQKQINLIGPSNEAEIWERHVLDGLQIGRLLPVNTRSILDLGSGAGVPGLMLAALMIGEKGIAIHLVDSDQKKAAFLNYAATKMGVKVRVHARRIEALDVGRVDVVVARGVAPLPKLLGLTRPYLSAGAVGLFHKGEQVEAEIAAAFEIGRFHMVKFPSLVHPNGCVLKCMELGYG